MAKGTIPISWPATYELLTPDQPRGLLVLLHGYRQRGKSVLARLGHCLSKKMIILAPDGLFPVPFRDGGRFRLGYAWFFFDPVANSYEIDMETGLQFLQALLADLDLLHLPKWIIGYSQGGYLAPFLAAQLSDVKQVVGINCRFRSEVLKDPLPFRLDALHGDDDQMVDPVRARNCHRELMVRGNHGRFVTVPGAGHEINGAIGAALRSLLVGEAAP